MHYVMTQSEITAEIKLIESECSRPYPTGQWYIRRRSRILAGLPPWLIEVKNHLTRHMSEGEAKCWVAKFVAAMDEHNPNLKHIKSSFSVHLLRASLELFDADVYSEIKPYIETVISLFESPTATEAAFLDAIRLAKSVRDYPFGPAPLAKTIAVQLASSYIHPDAVAIACGATAKAVEYNAAFREQNRSKKKKQYYKNLADSLVDLIREMPK
jgi:hypothetical protein